MSKILNINLEDYKLAPALGTHAHTHIYNADKTCDVGHLPSSQSGNGTAMLAK